MQKLYGRVGHRGSGKEEAMSSRANKNFIFKSPFCLIDLSALHQYNEELSTRY